MPQEADNLVVTLVGAILLAALIAVPALSWHPPATKPLSNPDMATSQATRTQVIATVAPTLTSTASPTPSPTRTSVPTPTPTVRPSPTPSASPSTMLRASPTPTPSETAVSGEPQDHYWLQRPIGSEGQDYVSRFYPYGSTARGQYQVHHGVEFENPVGTPVLAVAAGQVIVAGDDAETVYGPHPDFYGQLVVVELDREFHGQKVFTLYAHLSEISVRVGQRVKAGEVLGAGGMTGVAIGPHLHFEVRVGGNTYGDTRNPELWLKPFSGYGTIAGRVVDAQGKFIPQALVLLHRAKAPDRPWRETESYGPGVNPDEGWGENFLFGDVPEGSYVIKTFIEGLVYTREVEVEAGKTAFVVIKAVE